MFFIELQGAADGQLPAGGEGGQGRGLHRLGCRAFFYKNARTVHLCDEIGSSLQSCLKTSQRGRSFLKAQLNWDDGQRPGRLAKVRVELRQVWLMSPQCGLVTELQLGEAAPQAECPF